MTIRKLKCYCIPALLLLTWSSCQKVIDLKLANAAAQIVIEGNVVNIRGGAQTVLISRSVPFTNTNTFPPVSGATVTISDGKGNTYTLTESTITPGTYTAVFTGRPGYTYTLTVQTNGQTYTALSTMPQPVNFGPMSYAPNSFKKGSELVTVNFMDPVGIANQYRYVEYVNNTQVKEIFVSDDTFSDGGSVGINLYQSDITIATGDTVVVDEQCIDRPVYTYWFSLSQQQDNGAGGGTTPSNPPSNISNNALGYFSAHTTNLQGVIIQ